MERMEVKMTHDEEKRTETFGARKERVDEALDEFIKERMKEFWSEEQSYHRGVVIELLQEVVRQLK